MGSGRVTLDFNPPLAGKTLVYDVRIKKKLKTNEEKILALIHRRIPAVEAKKFELKIEKTKITLSMPTESFYIDGIQLAKRGIAMDIQRFIPNFTTINFVESFIKPDIAKKTKKGKAKKSTKKTTKRSKKKKETESKTVVKKEVKKIKKSDEKI